MRIARAIALLAVCEVASEVTCAAAPESLFETGQRLAIALGQWVGVAGNEGIEVRAELQVSLGPESARRAHECALARRAAHVEAVVRKERLRYLGEDILGDRRRAKLWWLASQVDHLEGSRLEWSVFDEHIGPVIDSADRSQDLKVAFAEVISSLVDRVHGDPTKLQTWENMVTVLFNVVGEPGLGERLRPLFETARDSEDPGADQASRVAGTSQQ
ncbi:hypothetical protein [Nocardia jejuensis]|uniref:hypothetical protein n=1 Tax=Nocardia jejuensis TaxID=328049 RepID=UPI000836718D|nr:hypothetical protein [Nocardia jejuensis]